MFGVQVDLLCTIQFILVNVLDNFFDAVFIFYKENKWEEPQFLWVRRYSLR